APVTFWCITVDPGGAPIMPPIRSPAVNTESHQPSPQARAPRVLHSRANCWSRLSASAGIAPSEWLIRYVVDSRIGKRSRYSASSMRANLQTHELRAGALRDPRVAECGQHEDRPAGDGPARDDVHRRRVGDDDLVCVGARPPQ